MVIDFESSQNFSFPDFKKLIALGFRDYLIDIRNNVVSNELSGQALKRRSGNLAGSIDYRIDGLIGKIGTFNGETKTSHYARFQHDGTIFLRPKKYITNEVRKMNLGDYLSYYIRRPNGI